MKKILLIIALILSALFAYKCVADHSVRIQNDIQSRLNQKFNMEGLSGNVVALVSGRDVILSGSVAEEDIKHRASEAAMSLDGVRAVKNQIVIVEAPQMAMPDIEQPIMPEVIVDSVDSNAPEMADMNADMNVNDMDMNMLPSEQPPVEEEVVVETAEPEAVIPMNAPKGLNVNTPEPMGEVPITPDTAPEMIIVTEKKPEVDECQNDLAAIMEKEQIQFASGNAVIQKDSYSVLNLLAAQTSKCVGMVIQINGYTDNSGDIDANVKLSLNRAKSVGKYLISKGVLQEIRVVGNGPNNPIADNATPEGRTKNRRIEFKVFKPSN